MESKEVPERLARELKGVEGKFRPGGSEEAQGNIKKVLDDSVERAMYDEFLGDMVGKGSNSYSSRKENTGNNGKGFDDCLLERVTSLEKEGSAMRRHMAEAVERATKLEKENKELRKMLTSFEAGEMQEAMMELQDDNEQLYTQIEEMEKFLKDYGLVWVGNAGANSRKGLSAEEELDAESKDTSDAMPDKGLHMYPVPFIAGKIKELNDGLAAEEASVRVYDQGNGQTHRKAKLMKADEFCDRIPVRIFRDGILIKRGPFRKHDSEGYQKFVRDVVDGYFPSEFRAEYPDGVVMDVTDLSGEDFDERKMASLASKTLLSRMPKTVVRNGEVVQVRGDLSDTLAGEPKRAPVVVETTSRREEKGGEGAKGEGGSEVTVQVRWLDGTKAMVLKMSPDDIVGDAREEIKRHFGGLECPPFKLRSAYPPKLLGDHMSMEEAGLSPRGVIVCCKIV